jgi:hypothetical protein
LVTNSSVFAKTVALKAKTPLTIAPAEALDQAELLAENKGFELKISKSPNFRI